MTPKTQLSQINYFIKKFTDIPRDQWIVGDYSSDDGKRRCVLGHCGAMKGTFNDYWGEEAYEINMLFYHLIGESVATVNDGNVPTWNKGHPKDNIIFALMYMKEKVSK